MGKFLDGTFIVRVADVDDLVFAAAILVLQDFHQRADSVVYVGKASFLIAAVDQGEGSLH